MPSQASPLPLFISYSHEDKAYLDRLKVFLKPLARGQEIDAWDDTRIKPGQLWKTEITNALQAARVAVVLVSPDFLASDFIDTNELPPLLTAAEERGVLLLTVVVGVVGNLKRYPDLAAFQAVNDIRQPLSGMPPHEQDEVWQKVVDTIEDFLANPR